MQKRKQRGTIVIFVFFVLFFIWILLQILAPFALPRGSVSTLTGSVRISDNQNIIHKMSFPLNFVYFCGDRMCHQIADRSLFLNDNQIAFCSRCTAIWFGLAVGVGFMVVYTIDLNKKFLIALIASLIPIGIDGIGQLLGFWVSTNHIRIFTGLPVGIMCGIAIGVILDELGTMQIFRNVHNFFSFSKKH